MQEIPKIIKDALIEIYGDNPMYYQLEWWYQRFTWYFINSGIPEEGVIGLLKNHKIPVAMVKRYGRSTGLIPETVAQNILTQRHDTHEFDSLAKQKVKVTKKKILDYRKRLEDEFRRIWIDQDSLEEIIKEECHEITDEEISRMILHGTSAENWAKNHINMAKTT